MEELIFVIGKEKTKQKINFPKILFLVYFFLIILIIAYFFFVQQTKGEFYQSLSAEFRTLTFTVPAKRGEILDRSGKKLAESILAFDLYINLLKASEVEKKIFSTLAKNNRVFYRGEYAFIRALPLAKISPIFLEKEKYPHLEIIPSYSRKYYGQESVGSFLGYIGFSPEKKDDLFYGLSGLERYYDVYLRGSPGKIVYQRKPSGEKGQKIQEVEARAGNNLVTTVNLAFQKKAYQLMSAYFREKGYQKGALVALNPQNGEVIALISFPSYDPNWFLHNPEKVKQILQDPMEPLFNRAISGQYSPGSTIKPIVAIAALTEKIITPEKKIYAGGVLKIPHPYLPGRFSVFHDNKVHGWTDIKKAIADSVNIYFYIIGGGYENQPGLGIEKLLRWWQFFGLGQKSGIDLPEEKTGFLPSPKNKYKIHPLNPIWRLGDTYNVSIGQGDLLVTPLQITLWTAALATNKLVKPYLVKEIISPEGEVIFQRKPEFVWQNLLNPDKLKVIQEGMRQTITKGTAKYLADLPFTLAGKSGTPEIFGKQKLNAIFTGYAPEKNPEIVLTILIEEVPAGSVAVLPLYKEVIKAYFEIAKQLPNRE